MQLPGDDGWSTDKMVAAMAAGSERSQLQHRVEQLEAEVAQLRAALAAVLTAAAQGLQTPTTSDDVRVDMRRETSDLE